MIDEREQQNRIEALANAVRHRLKEETADDVMKSAEKYFDFLQGGKSSDEITALRARLEKIRQLLIDMASCYPEEWVNEWDELMALVTGNSDYGKRRNCISCGKLALALTNGYCDACASLDFSGKQEVTVEKLHGG